MRWLLLLVILLGACTGTDLTPTPPAIDTAWGSALRLGEAEQSSAPTIALADGRANFMWVGADASGIHQDGRTWGSGSLSDQVVLPLPPRNPFALQTLPASTDSLHHLWLDQNSAGELRLYSALLGLPLTVQRGPIELTQQATRRFAAMRLPDGGALIVASGGLDYAPSLYAHTLDDEGRPRLQESYQVAFEADYPALLTMPDGTAFFYWLSTVDDLVYRAALLPNGQLDTPQAVLPGLTLEPTDRLDSFYAAADQAHTYLFWNIVTAEGIPQTWYSAAQSSADEWPAPRPLSLTGTASPVAIGFNAGDVEAVEPGGNSPGYVIPSGGVFPNLPTTVYDPAGQVGVLFWQGGQPIGMVNVAEARLIGPPQLAVDRALYLYLTWSALNDAGSSDLLAASLRFNP
ncbi:MAG: hypothetical protein J0M33_24655 [Anaerolineae bacterium]|nr:hypothetical protein [Anaerolineae bacterium]